jgi:hypothetical protein
VWPETQERVRLEMVLLRRQVDFTLPLLKKVESTEPEPYELQALAAHLHSFYTGIEKILGHIAKAIDGGMPSGFAWHSRLLTSMSQPTESRPAVISEDLYIRLYDYMTFRHMFHHAYTYDLKWRKMSDLVLHCEETLDRLEKELEAFFSTG